MGTCAAIAGAPPAGRAKCDGAGTPCAGSCDGVNGATCTYPSGKECGATCSSSSETISHCDAAGACKAGAPAGCNGFACDGDVRCKTACASAADCAPQFSCKGNACVPIAARCSDDGLSAINETEGLTTPCAPFRCDPAKAQCKDSCTSESDCADGYVCNSSNICTAAAPATEDSGGCAMREGATSGGSAMAFVVALGLLGARRRRAR
jgi:MYXO-CTERM domain-containing protein